MIYTGITHSKKCDRWALAAGVGIVVCLGIVWWNGWIGCAVAVLLNYIIIKTEPKHGGKKNAD